MLGFWAQLGLILCLLSLCFAIYKYIEGRKLVRHYEEQGFVALRGSHSFPLGLVSSLFEW